MSIAPDEDRTRETTGPRPRAVLLGVQLPGISDEVFAASLDELRRLAKTLGLEVVGRVTQRRDRLSAAAAIGEGKLKELAALTGGTGVVPSYAPADKDADEPETLSPPDGSKPAGVVLVDQDLSPRQARNLERATGAEVLDRSMVVVSIFQRHARTREAKLQVEIARLSYLAPRLRESGAGQDRQRGGIGGRGAGERSLELNRRQNRDRIAELRSELVVVTRTAETRRTRRSESQTVALVGYTNAGKSSLMRNLTRDGTYVADQLFATLDTTVRALSPLTRPRILVSDTVGFIKNLPHDLVASFRSTLQEAREASLLLHVVDASDPAFREQYGVTRQVLGELDADDAPSLVLLNKADLLTAEQRAALAKEFPEAILLSAHDPQDIARMHTRIVDFFEASMQDAEFKIPYSRQRQVALLHEHCRVLEEHYEEDGARVVVRAPAAVLGGVRAIIDGAPGEDG